MKNKFLIAILCLGLLTVYFACEKDDAIVKEEQVLDSPTSQITPTIKTVTFDEAGETFNRLTNAYQLDGFLDTSLESNVFSRSTLDTLGITIYTDNIKEVTAGDYTSYTMLIATPSTTDSKFYNLTIEDKNGEAGMFVTKYVPTEQWLSNKDHAFEGSMSTQRVDNFTTVGIDDGGGTNDDHYPGNCDGEIITTSFYLPYQCDCPGAHWPIDVDICSCSPKTGYYLETVDECIPSDGGSGPDDPSDPGDGTNSGGEVSDDNEPADPDQESIGGFVPNGDVPCEPPYSEWDIDFNCSLDDLEICSRDYGNNSSICDCVSNGGTLDDCVIEDLIDDMDKECPKDIIINFLNTDSDMVNIINSLFFGNSNNNIRFSDVDLPSSLGALASTVPPANMTLDENTHLDIRFDNNYLDNTTDLSIALITSHELVHVFLIYLYINDELLTTYPNYTEMSIAFENFDSNPTELNMEILQGEMHSVYDDFIDDMANATYSFAQANNINGATEEYCRKFAIGHHQNTDAFQSLTPSQQTEYSTIAANEQNGLTDAKGSKCEE